MEGDFGLECGTGGFHVQRLAHDAFDAVRREEVREAAPKDKRDLKNTRFALRKNPWNLSAMHNPRFQKIASTQDQARAEDQLRLDDHDGHCLHV